MPSLHPGSVFPSTGWGSLGGGQRSGARQNKWCQPYTHKVGVSEKASRTSLQERHGSSCTMGMFVLGQAEGVGILARCASGTIYRQHLILHLRSGANISPSKEYETQSPLTVPPPPSPTKQTQQQKENKKQNKTGSCICQRDSFECKHTEPFIQECPLPVCKCFYRHTHTHESLRTLCPPPTTFCMTLQTQQTRLRSLSAHIPPCSDSSAHLPRQSHHKPPPHCGRLKPAWSSSSLRCSVWILYQCTPPPPIPLPSLFILCPVTPGFELSYT